MRHRPASCVALRYPLNGDSRPADLGEEAYVTEISRFEEERARLNDLVLDKAPLSIRRFFAVDHDAYEDGALPKKTKELMGLVASLALRCDDCITYHLIETTRAGATRDEIEEALTIATVLEGIAPSAVSRSADKT